MDDIEASVTKGNLSRGMRNATVLLLVTALTAILGGTQAVLFYSNFTPRLAAANKLLFDLMVEKSQGGLFQSVGLQLESLRSLVAHGEDSESVLAIAADNFDDHFATAPLEAIETLRNDLPALGAGLKGASEEMARLGEVLDRLQEIYSDPYRRLLEDLEQPPLYLWPVAKILAEKSTYRDAATLNRALHLAQVGEIGTARVVLAGLHASADDPRMLGLTNYTLGRLQFELFLSRPEAEIYLQSVHYLRESLQADPNAPLAKRLFDYLLSLSQTESVPRSGEGEPTTPSEGEGAAISADKRKF